MLENKYLRKKIIKAIYKAKEGHIPSCLSIIDICNFVYTKMLKINKTNINNKFRDYFILSKGHGAVALYTVLNKIKLIPDKDFNTYSKDNGKLGGHPDISTKGVDSSTGSLGHGFCNALGLSLGLKIKGKNKHKVVCLVGDGECNEGVIWEAAHLATNLKLENFYCIVDMNNSSKQLLPIDDLEKKWKAFGWETILTDGHNTRDLEKKYNKIKRVKNKPKVLFAKTTKGKGVNFMENNGSWHHKIPNKKEFLKIQKILS